MGFVSSNDAILSRAVAFLREEVSPRANEIDSDVGALRWALGGLCEQSLMGLRRPTEFGGPAFSEPMFREFQENVARYSGSLAFLQTQHQSAVSMIAKGENEDLKRETLPKMANGDRLIGIGFSQLRRVGAPMLTALPVAGGYQLDGTVPWVTGFGLFHEFLIGAQLPDGRAVFGVVPFFDASGIRFGPVMRLAAMESPQTVTATLDGFFLSNENIAFIKPEGWIKNNDMINIALQGSFAIGCARAGLDQVQAAFEKKGLSFIKDCLDRLTAELDDCKREMVVAQSFGDEDVTTQDKLRIRAWAIDLAVRCAHAGVAAHSGASNSVSHPAQRVYREALVFTVSAQTSDVMQATLERISGVGTE